jgi:hypothetical protein
MFELLSLYYIYIDIDSGHVHPDLRYLGCDCGD